MEVYTGKGTIVGTVNNGGLFISGDIVIRLIETIPNCIMYLDIWFTSYDLVEKFRKDGMLSVDTISSTVIVEKWKKKMKKFGRGSKDYKFELKENVIILKWLDSKPLFQHLWAKDLYKMLSTGRSKMKIISN